MRKTARIGAGFLSGFDGNKRENDLKKFIIIFVGCALLSGCAKVRHLDQLLTLKALADEQEQLGQYVKEKNQNFDLMVKEAKEGTLEQYPNKRKIQRVFGDPVFARNVVTDGQDLESWLYRYATDYFGAEKIYLYFDLEGNLVKSQYMEGTYGKSGKETTPEDGQQEI